MTREQVIQKPLLTVRIWTRDVWFRSQPAVNLCMWTGAILKLFFGDPINCNINNQLDEPRTTQALICMCVDFN
jgi:hypothetical protein